MTAICGFLGLEDKNLLRKMCSYMWHRGEVRDTYMDDNICLTIIAQDDKPRLYHDGHYIVAVDQDVYAIGDEKANDPSVWRSSLESCTLNQPNPISNLRGSFAIFAANVDGKAKRAFLARDIYGTRSLYYSKIEDTLFFASEMKCFSAIDNLKMAINANALNSYLTSGFSPNEETILKNVSKVLPGELVEYKDGDFRSAEYWSPSPSENGPEDLSLWANATFMKLLEVIKLIVPAEEERTGIALSGGIDSSLIAATLKHTRNDLEVLSFSLDYSVDDNTELRMAANAADYFGFDHKVVQMDPERIVKDLSKLQWIYDEPMTKYTFIPTYYLFKTAEKYVRTVFTGDGGDELFIGYRSDYWEDPVPIRIFASMPNMLRKKAIKFLKSPTEALANSVICKNLSLAAEFFARESASNPKWQYRIASRVFQGYFAEEELPQLLTSCNNPSKITDEIARLLNRSRSKSNIEKESHAMIMTKLPDDLLRLDKAVGVTGIKARSPLLDPVITNFALSIPIGLRYRSRTTKHLLRYMIKKHGLLPEKIIRMKAKRGLTAPLQYWLTKTEIRPYIESLLDSDLSIFKVDYIRRIWPPKTYTKSLKAWNLAAFLLWLNTFPSGIARQLTVRN
jgi:asparagine synthase (glutamine-hydrolysing)